MAELARPYHTELVDRIRNAVWPLLIAHIEPYGLRSWHEILDALGQAMQEVQLAPENRWAESLLTSRFDILSRIETLSRTHEISSVQLGLGPLEVLPVPVVEG